MVASLGPHTITILRAPQIGSDYGTATRPDWDNATRAEVKGCSVQPAQGSEYTIDRDSTTELWTAWLPPSADLHAEDRVEWRGDTYDVDGQVQRWDFPPLDHLQVNLRRSEEASS